MENQIKVTQLPIIAYGFLTQIGEQVTERIKDLNIEGQVATEDTVKALKEMRTALTKEFDDYESQRKAVKEAVTNPYAEFEQSYKVEIAEKYKKAIEDLKNKINQVELEVKTKKRNSVKKYFDELCIAEGIDFVSFDQLGIEINLSTSEKKYKEQVTEVVYKINEDLKLIDTETFKAEILVVYKKTLNASKSITEVRQRKEAERLERERLQMHETQRRITNLTALGLVFHDLTRTYNYIQDESVMVSMEKIENSTTDEWRTIQENITDTIKALRTEAISAPETTAPIKQKAQAPQKSEQPVPNVTAEIFEAKFSVTGTFAELTALKNYLIENKLTYKTIN